MSGPATSCGSPFRMICHSSNYRAIRRPLAEPVRDRVAAIAPEAAAADLHAGRRLPAFVFGGVQHLLDAHHDRARRNGRRDLVDRLLLLDEARENRVELVVGRKRVLVGLVRPKLRGRRTRERTLGNHLAERPLCKRRPVRVAPARQAIDLGLVDILEHGKPAAHVAIQRGVADRHLRLVAGRQQHRSELVRERHQKQSANPRLEVLFGDVPRPPFENRRKRRLRARHHAARSGASGGECQAGRRQAALPPCSPGR